MGRKRVCDPEAVLDAFAQNLPLAEISRLLGGVSIGTLGAIVHAARRSGDPRAPLRRRPPPPVAAQPLGGGLPAHVRRRRLARRFPGSPADLAAAIARARVEVHRFRPGIATWGWRPSWLRV
jgi:hypothetical protein